MVAARECSAIVVRVWVNCQNGKVYCVRCNEGGDCTLVSVYSEDAVARLRRVLCFVTEIVQQNSDGFPICNKRPQSGGIQKKT
jgi:hypothetical protein